MSSVGQLQSVGHLHRTLLSAGWQFCRTDAGQFLTPTALPEATLSWLGTTVPATAASSLRELNQWSLDSEPVDFAAHDWWYRLRFIAAPVKKNQPVTLCFGGLATIADVWLNGQPLLHSENMFRRYDCDVSALLRDSNELFIRFAALTPLLGLKRPRPRWKAPMIQHQQLRWIRTTLLGHTPGWSPAATPVGPWREIWLERQLDVQVTQPLARTTLSNDAGVVEFSCIAIPLEENIRIAKCELQLQRAGQYVAAALTHHGNNVYQGILRIALPDKWWPHTHGEPALYNMQLRVELDGAHAPLQTIVIELGHTGFRSIQVDNSNDNFSVVVNDVPIFCRGACWTPLDVVSLNSDATHLQHAINLVRDAGMNMLRVTGNMIYENDEFLKLCDANGILLWQDFMFANMDYPETEEFIAEVGHEVSEQLNRLRAHPCVAVLCGNSEGEQQAAMFGATRDRWSPALFHRIIPDLLNKLGCDISYWPSSTHGGAFPHQNDAGTTSYYGVGAYMRTLEDARRSNVRFASECLAFANVPDDRSLQKMPNGLALKTHHPQWKSRTPRDLGAGWDFEDVRDYYLRLMFKVEPMQLRYADHDRYLELSRVVTGEVMAATYQEWRNEYSVCQGALIWFLRDLWHGAGWGILDADGAPKAAYYYLRRTLQPISVSISDEGCNGLYVHLINDGSRSVTGKLELAWYQHAETLVNKTTLDVQLEPHSRRKLPALQLLEYFTDLNHAYRFGPALCDVVVATLCDANATPIAETFHWPQGLPNIQHTQLGLRAQAKLLADGNALLTIYSRKLAQSLRITVDGYSCMDQYCHVAPDTQRVIHLTMIAPSNDRAARLRGHVKALNCEQRVNIEFVD